MSDRVVGSAEFELRATLDKLKKDLAEAQLVLKQATGNMEADANRSADGISAGMKKIGGAVAAVVAFSIAAAGALVAVGKASIQMAADLSDSAQRVGVSTDVLQELQFVARKTGGELGNAEAAIDSFGKKFASAAAGLSKGDLDAFKALGFSQEDLRNFGSVEQALDAVIDRISDLGTETDRTAAATKVGLGEMASAFREGGDAVAHLRDEARDAGHVMDAELIVKGARAQERLEDLSSVVSVEVAESFVLASDEIIAFANSLAEAIAKFNDLLAAWNRWRDRSEFTGDFPDETEQNAAKFGAAGALFAFARNRVRAGIRVVTGEQGRREDEYEEYASRRDWWNQTVGQFETKELPRTPGSPTLTPVGRTPRSDNSAQRAAEREARRAERVEQEIYRARQRLLDVSEGDLLTAQQRWDLAVDQLHMDREARDAEIKSKVARGEIKEVEAEQLRLAHEQADIVEDRILTDRSILEIRDEELANARLLSDLTADLLSLQSGAARTAKERQQIELELLAITQKQRRDALDAELNKTPGLTDDDRQRAWDMNGRREEAERAAVIRNNQGPLAEWRDASLKTADEISEAYERVAANGLDALNDGLVDAIINSRNLGEVFSNVAKQILADLLQISIRRGIIEPLAGTLFPGGGLGGFGGGAGNIGSSLFGWLGKLLPRRASGDLSWAGGMGVFNELGGELMTLPNGTQIIPHDVSMRMAAGAGERRGSGVTRVIVEPNDDRFNAYVDDRSAPQAGAAFSSARKAVPDDMARRDRYTLGRRR
ncbi:hypothetical protein [Brevundimonas sp. GCM10030266]|uniref:hypothetical protein n=1 Tax=Brevundimonas sp. GCM10030266 TaxID=3273386 RepID=UPI00361D0EDD